MLDRLISTNGYFTDGVYEGKRIFQYTSRDVVQANNNAVTHSLTLLDENGNSYFPNVINASRGIFKGDIEVTSNRSDTLNVTVPCAGYIKNPLDFSKFKSFIGSYTAGDGDWNIISVRHKNGYDDGQFYGMYIKSSLINSGNLTWGKQMGAEVG